MVSPPREDRLNLERVGVLVVEPNSAEQDLLAQVLTGFGVRNLRRCGDAEEAKIALATFDTGLIIADGSAADGAVYDFVAWLRRPAPEVLRLSGHVRMAEVVRARDCGANFIVTKPLAPRVLLDRIGWLGRETRGFLSIDDGYVGPDRRFKAFGPPPGEAGRRKDDLPLEVGEAVESNMSQDDIDALMNPRRA